MKTRFSDILQDPHFRALCVPIRVALVSSGWRHHHQTLNFWGLYDTFADATVSYATEPDRYLPALTALLDGLTRTDDRLRVKAEDLAGYLQLIDNHGAVVVSMFGAYSSARDRVVTPAQVAEATGTSESLWRNRAAAGEIPGAVKAGKQWLLQASVLETTFGVELPADVEDQSEPSEDDNEPPMSEAEYHETMRQLNRNLN